MPGSPLLAGVPSFTTGDNTTTSLAPGATLLAKWADGRDAIATKGRVESVSASPDSGEINPLSAAGQLVVNAGNTLGRHQLKIKKRGKGKGTVKSTPAGIKCGKTCKFNFGFGERVKLRAIPKKGSTAKLTGPGCHGKKTCTVTVNKATVIKARFSQKKHK